MCGICGLLYFDRERPVDLQTLTQMTHILHHRGPDSSGFYVEPGIGLGVRRLSIIDLKTGEQPLSNEEKTVTVICNGEIYNFLELRQELMASGHRFSTHSDVEVIAHLYEDLGPECIHRLRGMFGFALWDSQRSLLMLARDRLGIKPLYYAVGPKSLCFGSEIKPILLADLLRLKMNIGAIEDLFTFGFVMGPKTLFSGINQLLPGHYLLCHGGVTSIKRYWGISFPERNEKGLSKTSEEWAETLLEKLQESVRIHLRSDVPYAAWLSSGIDSSSIVALINKLTGKTLYTYSITFENPEFDEMNRQKTLSSFLEYPLVNEKVICRAKDFELFPKAVWHCENISVTGIEILQMVLSKSTSQRFKVVITGEGSDEVFGGYGWVRVDKLLRPFAVLPLSLRRIMLLGPLLPHFWPGASRVHLAPKEMNLIRYQSLIGPQRPCQTEIFFSTYLNSQLLQAKTSDPFLTPPNFHLWHPFTQLQYHELTIRLPNYITHHLDHTTMAHSLEARVPFLDHELIDFCSKIPPGLKMKGLREKYILRQSVRKILPKQIALRKKRGLRAPIDHWFREPLPDFAAEMLSDTCLEEKGYFHPIAVQRLLKGHRDGGWNAGAYLLGILAIQLWDELFLNHPIKESPA